MNPKKEDQPKPSIPILETMTLKRLLKTIGEACISSFIISELVFVYLLAGGISRFPENLVISLVVLSTGLGFVELLFPDEVVLLTSCTSVVTIIAIVNYLFGSSTNPHILPSDGSVIMDFLAAVGGGFSWALVLSAIYEFLTTRKLTKRHTEVLLSAVAGIAVIVLVFIYSQPIMIFFDEHPWFPATILGITTLVVGIIIGRWQRKEESKKNE